MTKKELQPVRGIRDGLHPDFTGPEPDSCTTAFRAGAGRIIVPNRPRADGIYDDQYQTRAEELVVDAIPTASNLGIEINVPRDKR